MNNNNNNLMAKKHTLLNFPQIENYIQIQYNYS